MKKWIVTGIVVVASICSTALPAYANVVRANGATSGKPIASVSNTGSAQAVASRSITGTTSKITNDGYHEIW